MITALKEEVQGKKKPLLGICLGMQALFEDSEENGYTKGLGFLKGNIVKMSDAAESRLRIPHIGWNLLEQCQESSVFERLSERPFVYMYIPIMHRIMHRRICWQTAAMAGCGFPGLYAGTMWLVPSFILKKAEKTDCRFCGGLRRSLYDHFTCN